MILLGSYANGFAPRDGQPLYPELWRGCVGAWAPCLGPTGLTLRDWSGRSNHGTLTNGPIFRPTGGIQSLAFDGSDDMSICSYSSAHDTVGGAGWMLSAWTYTTSNPAIGTIICRGDLTNIPQQRDFFLFSNSGNWSIQNATGGNFPIISSAGALLLNRWQHVAAYCHASGSAGLIVDGKQVATGTLRTDVPATTSRFITIGRSNNGGDGYSFPWNGSIGDVRMYSIVNPGLLYTLSKRPGIAYELAPRRRSSAAVQFNRRRRLLVGAGS
jgi:hypothetical protein